VTTSIEQNPFRYFSITDHGVSKSKEAFRKLIDTHYSNSGNVGHSFLFIHGLDNTFFDAAVRLGQLMVDLPHSGVPFLFSWPSDRHRGGRVPGGRNYYNKSRYLDTQILARNSQKHVLLTMDELGKQGRPIDVVAHSMGADLLLKSMVMRDLSQENLPPPPPVQIPQGVAFVRSTSIVLAAPDVSTREFDEDLRPQILKSARNILVYCADDPALSLFSQGWNNSDQRLGYCVGPGRQMDGVELVTIEGNLPDPHSYFLASSTVLQDMKRAFGNIVLPSGGSRQIKLK
jgi:esterase/lipase superfamily enzyme